MFGEAEIKTLVASTLGSVDVTGMHAEDTTMTSYQDFSAPISAGEGACGGLVDRVLSQLMRCLETFNRNDQSSSGRQVTR